MKKLSLNAATFSKGEVLTRNQLKKVMGGNSSATGGCSVPGTKCTSSSECGGKCPNCVAIPGQTYSICATS